MELLNFSQTIRKRKPGRLKGKMIIKVDRKEQKKKKNLNVSKLLLLYFIKSEPHHRDEGSEALQPSMNLIF